MKMKWTGNLDQDLEMSRTENVKKDVKRVLRINSPKGYELFLKAFEGKEIIQRSEFIEWYSELIFEGKKEWDFKKATWILVEDITYYYKIGMIK